MSETPKDSDRLVVFLRQHARVPPSPAPDLEVKIMTAVAVSPQIKTLPQRRWPILSAIAASMLIAWVGTNLLMPPKPSAAELASLEAFLENTWEDAEATSISSDTQIYEFDNSNSNNSANNNTDDQRSR